MKLSPTLIGLGGRLRAGKDAAADHLVAEHGFVKLGMSDALHEAMLAIDPYVPTNRIFNRETDAWMIPAGVFRYSEICAAVSYVEAKKIPEVRRLLQNLGTEVGRNMMGENIWSNIMARKIDDHRGAGHPVVVTGLRFPNEIQMVRELGGVTAWIDRPSEKVTSASMHASENGVTEHDFGHVILNNATLQELHQIMDAFVAGVS